MAHRVTRSILVDAPVGVVWDLLVDTRRWAEWGPSIRSVHCDPPVIAAGARGRVRTVVGVTLPFEVTAFEPGRSWTWKVVGIPATGHRVEARGASTIVEFDVPRAAAPYAIVLGRGLDRLRRIAEASTR